MRRLQRRLVAGRGRLLRGGVEAAAGEPVPDLDRVPILVLGCYRSGTSLLRRCLDSHSRIACPPETQWLVHLAAVLDAPSAARGLAGIGVDLDEAAGDLRALVDRYMRRYAESRGKPRWADKSPGVSAHLPGVARLFPEARYLVITRDGMDVAASLGETHSHWWQLDPYLEKTPDKHLAAAHYWVDVNARIAQFRGTHADRCHLLRYEDLTAKPEATLRAAFGFLGERFEHQVLDFNRQLHDSGLEDHIVGTTVRFRDRTGTHRRLPQSLQRSIWTVVGEQMVALGYEDRRY